MSTEMERLRPSKKKRIGLIITSILFVLVIIYFFVPLYLPSRFFDSLCYPLPSPEGKWVILHTYVQNRIEEQRKCTIRAEEFELCRIKCEQEDNKRLGGFFQDMKCSDFCYKN